MKAISGIVNVMINILYYRYVNVPVKGAFVVDENLHDLTPWKPEPTALPEEWSAFVKHLENLATTSASLLPAYVLDVRYNARRVGDQLRNWQIPWEAVVAGYLWEYDESFIRSAGLVGSDAVIACKRQSALYARAIEVEDLPLLLTPPYEDLGALFLAIATYFQTLKIILEQSGDRPCDAKKQISIKKLTLVLRNILKRLGIWMLKREIEDLSERLCAPRKFKMLRKELRYILQRDDALIQAASQSLLNAYQEAAQSPILIDLVPSGVVGLTRRQQSQLIIAPEMPINGFDLTTFNVIVPTVKDCYTAFGVLSQLGYIQERVVEQLTNPKPNGSSCILLRLQLKLPGELRQAPGHKNDPHYDCHLRIGTHLMHAVTWYGCLHPSFYPLYTKLLQRKDYVAPSISELWHSKEGKIFLAIQEDLTNSRMLPDEQAPLTVYDKERKPVRLSKAATALDFAYAMGPDVGNYTAEAFVNNRKSPLYRELDAGDIVEIRTANYIQTQRDWLRRNFARTAKARNEIHKSLRRSYQERRGYNQLNEILDRNHYMLTQETLEDELRQLVKQQRLGTVVEYVMLLDTGKDPRYTPEWAAQQIMEQIAERNEISTAELAKPTWIPVLDMSSIRGKNSVYRQRLCGICEPEYSHPIVGQVRKRTGELVVHKENCSHLIDSSMELLPMVWQPQSAPFRVSFYVIGQDRHGLVLDLTRSLRSYQCNLVYLHAEAIDFGQARISFKVELRLDSVAFDIQQAIRKIEGVERVEIDAATTPRRVMDRLQRQRKQRGLNYADFDRIFREIIVAQPPRKEYLKNPFDISRPPPPKMFFGRSQEMAVMQEILCSGEQGKALILYGPLRSGKSSICANFMYHYILFDHHAPRPVWGLVHSLQNARWENEETIFAQLAEGISKQFGAQFQRVTPSWQEYNMPDPQARFRHFVRDCIVQVPHSRLILALDEFGGAVEAFQDGTLPFRFFTLWRELLQEVPQISLLFALPTNAFSILSSAKFANVFTFTRSKKVDFLDPVGARQLLVDPLREQYIEVHPMTVALAQRLTGGNPYYLAMLGQQLIEQLNRDVQCQLVTDDELRIVAEQIIEENPGYNFDFLKQELLGEEMRVLEAIVNLTRQIKQSKVQCKVIADWLKMSVYDTRKHLDRLRDGLILDENGPSANPFYSFRIELVRRWLLHHREFFA